MGEPSRVLTEGDQRAIQEVMSGIMFKAHNVMPGYSQKDLPLQSACESCTRLELALDFWLYKHREVEKDD